MRKNFNELGEVFRTSIYMPTVGPLSIINTLNPGDVETVLRDPYLFIKGGLGSTLAKDFLGHGIFTSDGQRWHNQRKTASHIFNVRNFRDVFSGDFLEEVKLLTNHLGKAHELGAIVDLQDLLLRCTLDSFGRLGWFRQSFSVLRHVKLIPCRLQPWGPISAVLIKSARSSTGNTSFLKLHSWKASTT